MGSPRLGQLLAKQHPLQKPEQQPAARHAPQANGHNEQPHAPQGLNAGVLQALINSMNRRSNQGAQPAGQDTQAGAAALDTASAAMQEHLAKSVIHTSTEWCEPPEVSFELEADMAPRACARTALSSLCSSCARRKR